MTELVLREATEADAEAIVALLHAAFDEYRGRLDPPSGVHQETAETVRRKMATTRVVLVLAGGAAAGCVFYEPGANRLHLGRLAVFPARRRRGCGRRLIEYVEARARELGLPCVRLGVRLALPDLRAYYEREGYRVVEYRAHDGYTAPTYVMLEKDVLSRHPVGRT
jgi:ribosomal protein S18 acetylase RimI-like enzyme